MFIAIIMEGYDTVKEREKEAAEETARLSQFLVKVHNGMINSSSSSSSSTTTTSSSSSSSSSQQQQP